jgi:hypothetical protein
MLPCISAEAQNHVFVLVDVSGSRKSDTPLKIEAKNQVFNLLMGRYSANGWVAKDVTDSKINAVISAPAQQTPLIEKNSWFFLMPFGNKDTYNNYQSVRNVNSPGDFENLFNKAYPTSFSDNWTYMRIAEAFTVSLAKSYSLSDYYIFQVTDAMEDNTGSQAKYTQFEKDLLLEYNSKNYSIVENIGTLIKNDYYIKMLKVENVQTSKIKPAPGVTPPPAAVDALAVIKINSPTGRKNKEAEIKNEKVTISWTCTNCPQDIRYTVNISEYDGGKFKDTRKNLTTNSTSLKLSDGKYRITVLASNHPASPDTTFVDINTDGGGGGLVLLLLLAGGGGLGYYFWNKRRQDKIKSSLAKDAENDIFSNSDSSKSDSPFNSNSEYF